MSLSPLHALGAFNLLPSPVQLPSLSVSADFAGLLQQAVRSLIAGTDSATPHAEGLSELQALLAEFQSGVKQALERSGLEVPPDLRLGLDDAGTLRVHSAHANAPQIEAALREQPKLAGLFRALQTIGL